MCIWYSTAEWSTKHLTINCVLLTLAADARVVGFLVSFLWSFYSLIGSCHTIYANDDKVSNTHARNYTCNPGLSLSVFWENWCCSWCLMFIVFLDNGSQVAERIEFESSHTSPTSNNGSLQVCKTNISFSGWIIWSRLLSWAQYQDWLQSWNATGNEYVIAVYKEVHWLYLNPFTGTVDFMCLTMVLLAAVGWF